MSESDEADLLSRKLPPQIDAKEARRKTLLGAAQWDQRTLRMPTALALAVAVLALVTLSSTAEAQNWFAQVFHLSGAASRSVSLSDARTRGLPLPESAELPGGWRLQERGAVSMTRTPESTSVSLQYERDGVRGMNVRAMRGLSMFGTGGVPHDETLVVAGRTVYVDRSHGEVQVFVRLDDAEISIHVFGPALAARPLTADQISDLVRSLVE